MAFLFSFQRSLKIERLPATTVRRDITMLYSDKIGFLALMNDLLDMQPAFTALTPIQLVRKSELSPGNLVA